MALTLNDVLTSLSYRLGEDSVPTDTNEKNRRIRFVNQAYRKLASQAAWWFLQKETTFDSKLNTEIYTTTDGFPTDFRFPVELRVDDYVYTPVPESKVFGLYDSGMQIFNYGNLASSKHFYVYAGKLHILPATPAVGTDNISLKYMCSVAPVSSLTDTFLIPDTYLEALSAYAYGRLCQQDGDRGGAADGFGEYDEIVADMMVEQNRINFMNQSARPVHPSYLVD